MTDLTLSVYARRYDTSMHYKTDALHNKMYVKAQENWANDRFRAHGFLFLNEAYEMLGFSRTMTGQFVGWALEKDHESISFSWFEEEDGTVWIDFNVQGAEIHELLGDGS